MHQSSTKTAAGLDRAGQVLSAHLAGARTQQRRAKGCCRCRVEQKKILTGPDPRRWKALAVLGVAYLMVMLDVSIVNVALP